MSNNDNFDREYRMSFGQAGKKSIVIGERTLEQPIPLRISFSFQKSDLETANTGTISIWNLNKQHLSVLNQKNCIVSLSAGYGNRLSMIFTGVVSIVSTTRDGADIKTDIEVVDNLIELRCKYLSLSYSGKVNWKTIFEDIAQQLGVVVTFSHNAKFSNVSNGFTFVGLAKDALTKGCNSCGLSWNLQNGVLQIKKPGDVMSNYVYLLNSSSGIIGIPERVDISDGDETEKKQLGWDVEYLLNGAINIGDYVKLETDTVKGYFGVYAIDYTGDNISGDWTCKTTLVEV